MLEIRSLTEEYLEDAARLVSQRYRRLCDQIPELPKRYNRVDTLLPLLVNILSASGIGVVAIRDNRLVGFLTGWQMPSFRGRRSIYSPEWANGADLENSALIYQEMYGQLAAAWVADRYIAHYISLFPNDTDALQAWHWMGFGMISVDALRNLDGIRSPGARACIRRADIQDIEQVINLRDALRNYIQNAPIFLLTDKKGRSFFDTWLQDPDRDVWLGYLKNEPVAMLMLGPADADVCTIIQDKKTTSIYAAFTLNKARQGGLATDLLDCALRSARAAGYERCAVSFEPMNLLGSRFWMKYFQPVCFSILRFIDDRVIHTLQDEKMEPDL